MTCFLVWEGYGSVLENGRRIATDLSAEQTTSRLQVAVICGDASSREVSYETVDSVTPAGLALASFEEPPNNAGRSWCDLSAGF